VGQIELKPELAKVGLEIRVVSNDQAEVLSILRGVISRLDHTPMFGDARRYTSVATCSSRFLTETAVTPYIQAATDGSGGSSGSPVIAESGCAVGMVVGICHMASTDFYLPLERLCNNRSMDGPS